MVSSSNPFRDPDFVTPNSTGPSAIIEVTPAAGPSSVVNEQPNSSTESNHYRGPEPGSVDASVVDEILEELPPAYTQTADLSHGESTIELGPRRPFEQPPRRPLQQQRYLAPLRTGWQDPQFGWQNTQATGAGWASGNPGEVYRNASVSRRPPPPPHPSLRTNPRPRSAPTSPRPLSDFARDFYQTGPAELPDSDDASGEVQPQPTTNGYAPPPGRPPPPTGSVSASSSTPIINTGRPPDDGRPTREPVPGHPLLRNGKTLVYPAGYECRKCHNTGYKNFDPSHPCSKCWDRYSKTYSGTLVYAPWDSTESSNARTIYQRPLPRFSPPQDSLLERRSTQSLDRPSVSTRASSQAYAAPTTPYATHLPLPGGGVLPMNSLQRPPPSSPIMVSRGPPPPGAIRMHPGDRRLGGDLCWRCGGSGVTSLFLFDESTCSVCKGIGRTY